MWLYLCVCMSLVWMSTVGGWISLCVCMSLLVESIEGSVDKQLMVQRPPRKAPSMPVLGVDSSTTGWQSTASDMDCQQSTSEPGDVDCRQSTSELGDRHSLTSSQTPPVEDQEAQSGLHIENS